MFVSVYSRGLDMLLDMARAPRQRRRALFWTGMAAALVAAPLSAALSTLQDLSDVDGHREAFGWLFIRAVFFMVGGLLLGGIGLVVAVIALAVVSSIHARRGTAAKGEVAGARYLVGILVLLLFVVALPISLFLLDTPAQRLTFGLTCAGLIGLTFAVLLGIGQLADRRAKAVGTPNWTKGLVQTGLSPEGYAAAVGILMVSVSSIAVAVSGVDIQGTEVLFACNLTDCSSIGLTIAGWLIVALPFVLILVAAAFWPRLSRAARIALILTTLLLCGNGALFFPGGQSPP